MSGCVSPGIGRPTATEPRHVLLQVPFYPDHTDQCGPSALASVLGFWGTTTEPGQLKDEIYLGNLKGSLPIDLLLAAQARGMSAEILDEGLPQLKKELDAGRPVIVFVNLGYRLIPVGHYMVVTGYDDRRRAIYAHSGMDKNGLMSYKRFLKQWKRTDLWALSIRPLSR